MQLHERVTLKMKNKKFMYTVYFILIIIFIKVIIIILIRLVLLDTWCSRYCWSILILLSKNKFSLVFVNLKKKFDLQFFFAVIVWLHFILNLFLIPLLNKRDSTEWINQLPSMNLIARSQRGIKTPEGCFTLLHLSCLLSLHIQDGNFEMHNIIYK